VGGQFSVGASGYYLEGGERADAFDEATISGEIESFLGNVLRVGKDLPLGYSVASPSLLVDELSLGGSE
jgi:PmbA protein